MPPPPPPPLQPCPNLPPRRGSLAPALRHTRLSGVNGDNDTAVEAELMSAFADPKFTRGNTGAKLKRWRRGAVATGLHSSLWVRS